MNARLLMGSGAILSSVLLAACAPEEDAEPATGPQTVDISYGEPALVVIVNAQVDTSLTTRAVAQPGQSIENVYVRSQDGAEDQTDVSGIAILSGIKGGYTTLTLEGDGESGTVGVQVNETGLTEVFVSMRADGVTPITQVDWLGEPVEPPTPMATGGVMVTVVGSEYSGKAFILSEEAYGSGLEIRADDVEIYGEGFLQSWPVVSGPVKVYGRNVQLRGVWIEGSLEVYGPQFAMTFGGVDEGVTVSGSSAAFLDTYFCQSFQATGDSLLVARSPLLPDASRCSK